MMKLPQAQSGPKPEASEEAGKPVIQQKILIIEDNYDAAESLRMLLSLEGHDARMAASGDEALAIVKEWTPRTVLCDIGLPKMDGYTVCKMLREMPALKNAMFIALTGYGQDQDVERAAQAGFHKHLTKPVAPEKIIELLGGEGERNA